MPDLSDALAEALRAREDRSAIFHLCRSVIRDFSAQSKLASVTHPFGFILYTLRRYDDGSMLRLHIWPAEQRYQSSELLVHDHIYAFTSLILEGDLTETRYDVRFSNAGDLYVYEVGYGKGTSILRISDGRATIVAQSELRHISSEYYEIREGEFHKAVAKPNAITASILLTSVATRKKARVLTASAMEPRIDFARQRPQDGFSDKLLRSLFGNDVF